MATDHLSPEPLPGISTMPDRRPGLSLGVLLQRSIALRLPVGGIAIAFGPSWFLIAPLATWGVGVLFVPVVAPALAGAQVWAAATATAVLMIVSLVLHALAHIGATRLTRGEVPGAVRLYPTGDAAHAWPAARHAWQEAAVALSGIGVHLILAGLCWWLWDRQLHPLVNPVVLFLAIFNGVLAILNLAPGFPLDGGRLTRALLWGFLHTPSRSSRLAMVLGWSLVFVLALWAFVLNAQGARFSQETAAATLTVALLLALPLWRVRGWQWDRPAPPPLSAWQCARDGLLVSVLLLLLLLAPVALVPTVNGLQAPGIAVAVEPMVQVAPEQRHAPAGSFLLTTVFAQTPILAGQWAIATLDPAMEVVPGERVVPRDTSPRELVARSYRQLEESELTATVVGLRLAGYEPLLRGTGAEIVQIVPESLARDLLRPGDRIVELNGQPIALATDLVELVRAQSAAASVRLVVARGDETLALTVPLIQPTSADQQPRLGVSVRTADLTTDLPFPVEITPQKVVGGPSAGLMFTLTIYNLITPEDLTAGHRIAGTGTINYAGEVGPIGGIAQKVAGAEAAGATYFLAPAEQAEAARRVAHHITVVPVKTVDEAIAFLRTLEPPDR